MILTNDINFLEELFALLFANAKDYGFSNQVLEDKITSSPFINTLEKGDANLYLTPMSKIIADILGINENKVATNTFDSVGFWLGYLYMKLFTIYRKSFNYIFLYLPIEKAENMFHLYHEMDWGQSFNRFEELEKECTILSKLLKIKKTTMDTLSIRTGINKNTIMKYCQDNEYIYGAGLDNIYSISTALDVDMSLFIRKLNIFTNSMTFEFDKENILYRSHLGFYLASIYVPHIRNGKFKYQDQKFTNEKGDYLIVKTIENFDDFDEEVYFGLLTERNLLRISSSKYKNRKILVLFVNDCSDSKTNNTYLDQSKFDEIYLIDRKYFFDVFKNKKREIDYLTYKSLIMRAKSKFKYDFALHS